MIEPSPEPGAASGSDVTARSFEAVLLDLDGTLIDSTASVERCWRQWGREFGVTLPAVLEHGLPARSIVARYLPADLIEAGADRIGALEIADTEGITPLPGARELLAAMPAQRVAIVTSCGAELAAARLAAAGLTAPPVTVTVDQLRRGKPDPEGYLLAASRLGVDPAQCLVFEDAPGGLAAGRAAGCATIGLTTTTDPAELSADLLIASLAELQVDVWAEGVRFSFAT
jgi:sugar-phosphatase